MKNVPFFNYPFIFDSREEDYMRIIRDTCKRGAFIMQEDVSNFESNIAKYCGVKHAIAMANATDALHLAVRAAGIGPGDEVLFSSHTMSATAAAIHFAGATPVPVDCNEHNLFDPRDAEKRLSNRTKGIMPTHLNGRTCNMDPILRLAEDHDLVLFEDAAQALGSKFKGKCAGTFGYAGAVSFYPAKTLGCFGDGGVILTDDDDADAKLRLLRDHGRSGGRGETVMWGLNSRLDNLQAAILNYNLSLYDESIERRREIGSLYHKHLSSLSQLTLPAPPNSDENHWDIFQNYELQAENRDALRTFLADRGIGTMIQWGGKAVHQIEAFGFDVSLPKTEKFFDSCLMLPLNLSLANEDVEYVCDTIHEFYAK